MNLMVFICSCAWRFFGRLTVVPIVTGMCSYRPHPTAGPERRSGASYPKRASTAQYSFFDQKSPLQACLSMMNIASTSLPTIGHSNEQRWPTRDREPPGSNLSLAMVARVRTSRRSRSHGTRTADSPFTQSLTPAKSPSYTPARKHWQLTR